MVSQFGCPSALHYPIISFPKGAAFELAEIGNWLAYLRDGMRKFLQYLLPWCSGQTNLLPFKIHKRHAERILLPYHVQTR